MDDRGFRGAGLNALPEQRSAAAAARAGTTARRWPWWAVAIIALGVLSHVDSLRWGFQWDDYVHQAVFRGLIAPNAIPKWNVYDFTGADRTDPGIAADFLLPWWTDPDMQARFFRPVTSASLWLDYLLFGDWAPGYHLTSLVLFAVLLALTWRLLNALEMPAAAAGWALACVALDDVHTVPVGWIANRNSLLALLFTVAAVLAALRYARAPRWSWLLLSLALTLLATCSKESGLAATVLATGAVLFYGGAVGETLGAGLRRTLRTSAPWLFGALGAAFLGFYVLSGYGARSVEYVVPWQEPAAFFARLGLIYPMGLFALAFGFPTSFLLFKPAMIPATLASAIVVLGATAAIYWRAMTWSRPVAFALLWIAFTLLVETGGSLAERLWMSASVGSAILVGLFLARVSPWIGEPNWRRAPALALGAVLFLANIVGGIPGTLFGGFVMRTLGGSDRALAVSAPIDTAVDGTRDVIVLAARSPTLLLSIPFTWRVVHDDPATRIHALQYQGRALRITRADERSLIVESLSQPLRQNVLEMVFCSRRPPPPVGTRLRCPGFEAVVLDVEPDGIRRVRLEFAASLANARVQFLTYEPGRLARFAVPKIGETVETPEWPLPNIFE